MISTKDMLEWNLNIISDFSDLEEMVIFPPNYTFTNQEVWALLKRDVLNRVGNQIAVDVDSYDEAFGESDPLDAYAYDFETGKFTLEGKGNVAREAGISDDTSKLNIEDTIFFPLNAKFEDSDIGKDMINVQGHFAMSNESYRIHFGDPLGGINNGKK